jgi:hypothetical protein
MMLTTILFLTIYPDYIALNRQLLKAAIADWQRAISSDPQKLQKLPSDVQANENKQRALKSWKRISRFDEDLLLIFAHGPSNS